MATAIGTEDSVVFGSVSKNSWATDPGATAKFYVLRFVEENARNALLPALTVCAGANKNAVMQFDSHRREVMGREER
jgi:hypothetical protein